MSDTPSDRLYEYLRSRNDWAKDHLAPEQQNITYGDHWARFYDVSSQLIIFGRVDPLAETSESPDEQEREYLRHETERRMANGYVYGKCYSKVTVPGEYGFTPKFEIWPIDEDVFNAARDVNWEFTHLPIGVRIELSTAYGWWHSHMAVVGHHAPVVEEEGES
jgi:hypothetical protein